MNSLPVINISCSPILVSRSSVTAPGFVTATFITSISLRHCAAARKTMIRHILLSGTHFSARRNHSVRSSQRRLCSPPPVKCAFQHSSAAGSQPHIHFFIAVTDMGRNWQVLLKKYCILRRSFPAVCSLHSTVNWTLQFMQCWRRNLCKATLIWFMLNVNYEKMLSIYFCISLSVTDLPSSLPTFCLISVIKDR